MDEDDTDEDGEERMNLTLVMNFNVKVVLCSCGKAFKLPMEGQDNCEEPACESQENQSSLVDLKESMKERF